MVLIESMVTGHKYTVIRERLADKLELVRFDPYGMYVSLKSGSWTHALNALSWTCRPCQNYNIVIGRCNE